MNGTVNDIINVLDGALFAQCFTAWVEGLGEPALVSTALEVVAIDGQTSRRRMNATRTLCRCTWCPPEPTASAWCLANRRRAQSNEITAIQLLRERVALTGALGTIVARGSQTKIAQAILDRGEGCLLAVKDNQPSMHEQPL